MRKQLLDRLNSLSDAKYKEFSQKLSPEVKFIGVRLPALRKLSKQLLKEFGNSLLDYRLTHASFFEEKFIKAYAVGNAPLKLQERFSHIRNFLPHIDGWAINDSFCTMLKDCKDNLEAYFLFIDPLLLSHECYTVRFALVMCNNYYVRTEYADRILKRLVLIDTKEYYVHMALAWLIASLYTYNRDKTLQWLLSSGLDNKTFNKAISKMTESLTTSKEEKEYLKTLKRKA